MQIRLKIFLSIVTIELIVILALLVGAQGNFSLSKLAILGISLAALSALLLASYLTHLLGLSGHKGNFNSNKTFSGDTGDETQVLEGDNDIVANSQTSEDIPDWNDKWMASMVDSMIDGVVVIDTKGRITLFNSAAETIFGYPANEVFGRNVNMLMPEPFRSNHDQYLRNFLTTGIKRIIGFGREVLGLRKDGTIFPMDLSITEFQLGGDSGFIGTVRDITVRKELYEKLVTSESIQKAVLENSLDAIIIIDAAGHICEFNPAAEHIFGYGSEIVLGKLLYEYLIPERFRDAHRQGVKRYLDTGEHNVLGKRVELSALNSSGEEFPIELTINPIYHNGRIFFTASIRDITESKKNQKELQQALEQANQASMFKSQFLSTMSHEIRTPLNIILGTQELIADTPLDDTQKYYLKLASDAGNTLLTLVTDIIDLSKVEAGKLELEQHVFDPTKLVEEVLQLVNVKAQEKHLALCSNIESEVMPLIKGDSWRLRQVLLNLLTNAVKFTGKGGVSIRVTPNHGDKAHGLLLFEVIDSGIGIDEDMQKRLFQPFIQADPSDTRNYGGSGLGLAISKALVKLWNGKIGLESQLGQGSRFWFTFGEKVDVTEISVDVRDEAPKPSTTTRATILLVEDSPANQAVLSAILRNAGHEVDVVDNGADAITAVQARAYDLIFMDVSMPNMDGMEATRHIRALGGIAADLPIIAMTAHAFKGYRDGCIISGMNDFASKPISKKQLLALVDQWHKGIRFNSGASVAQSVPELVPDLLDEQVLLDMSVDAGMADIAPLMGIFVQELIEHRANIMQAIENQALDVLAHEVHILKSTAGTFGANPLRDIAVECNEHCHEGDLAMALGSAHRLLPCLEATLNTLEARITR